jgi:hypothetical protein
MAEKKFHHGKNSGRRGKAERAREKNISAEHRVGEMLAHLRHFLPSQGPIKDFVHHNTLHTFQDMGLSFHEAIRAASQLYGAAEYLPFSTYRALYAGGKISEAALAGVLARSGDTTGVLREQMLKGEFPDVLRRPGFRTQVSLHRSSKIPQR